MHFQHFGSQLRILFWPGELLVSSRYLLVERGLSTTRAVTATRLAWFLPLNSLPPPTNATSAKLLQREHAQCRWVEGLQMHTRAPMRLLKSSLFFALILGQFPSPAQSFDPRRHITLGERHPNVLSSNPTLRAAHLDQIVQPIVTIIEFPDGTRVRKVGSGFIVGNRYFTVNHNLTSPIASESATKTSYISGVPVTPRYTNTTQDIAVFDLPDTLCDVFCNELLMRSEGPLKRERSIYWLRKFDGEHVLKKGRILNYAALGSAGTPTELSLNCDLNLVVEIDTPFVSGSSGAPVLDANTHQILGIIQGRFENGRGQTGYFKPIDCVEQLMRRDRSSTTFLSVLQ